MPQDSAPSHGSADSDRIIDYRSRFDLSQRRYLVLGGGQGMGRQVSHALAQLGAEVIVVDVDRDRADAVCAEIGSRATSEQVDATDNSEMAALAERAGELDGVVDVIGMARYGPLLDISDEDWRWEESIVLRHALLTLRHFGRRLRDRGEGSVTFVSSVSGIGSSPVHAAYGVYKAALGSLVRSASIELGPYGVRVNAVAPGFVVTPRISAVLDSDALENTRTQIPLQRLTLPADVASALAFLVSDLARTITGQVMIVDGGATNKYPYDMSGF
ncbi:SDR family NAD(P)-dependent oxidoreductase [Rhodococcus sp. B50]|uniref:SDR family NAD(P)-dependent oxidoreductase n=1 Tax=Rhodococcus sp. B50 TaxID=2682847 RepID=UPI001BD31FD5|nr:SDR family oxidoreductase [Rhodococcus sp. B50]MBS9374895.1 Oxidoreductase UcpA [Rhodococcus sp. B50]